eukprot:1448946-Pyramimonas_sp.AAC.1
MERLSQKSLYEDEGESLQLQTHEKASRNTRQDPENPPEKENEKSKRAISSTMGETSAMPIFTLGSCGDIDSRRTEACNSKKS